MAEPVEMGLFQWALTGLAAAGAGATGWLFRRQDRLERAVEKMAETVKQQHRDTANKHDNDQADLWQALEAHRKETRERDAEQERLSREFRERTLRDLSDIKVALAAIAPRAPQGAA